MTLTIRNQQGKVALSKSSIRKQIQKILLVLNFPRNYELSVVFVDDRRIKILNKKYLNRNTPTDVLAFETRDIVISTETAKRNSRIFKTTFHQELLLYIIHGILHLLGYNDILPKDRRLMEKKQRQILAKII